MEKFFEEGELTEEEINKGLNIGFLNGDLYPVFCLSAKKDIGTKRLMEFIINVAPSPENGVVKSTDDKDIVCDPNGPTTIFIYKTGVEQHLGEVSYFKVISGKLSEGQDVVNPETGNKERISAIYAVAGKKKEKISEIVAGDLGCTVKLKAVKTNQTLAQPGSDLVVKPIVFPPAKYRTAIKAKVGICFKS